MNKDYFLDLSKEISYALRHNPSKYSIELDEEGWAYLSKLTKALKKQEKWSNLEITDIKQMIEASEKKVMKLQVPKSGHSTGILKLMKSNIIKQSHLCIYIMEQ